MGEGQNAGQQLLILFHNVFLSNKDGNHFLNHALLVIFILRQLTLSQRQILDSSELKEFADNNFKFDENGRKFPKRLENTVGKGEIAGHETS